MKNQGSAKQEPGPEGRSRDGTNNPAKDRKTEREGRVTVLEPHGFALRPVAE
jgi:hypothetical protein